MLVDGQLASVGREDDSAQLRWLLVAPEARGSGLGRRLIREALDFCRAIGCRSVYLWTVSVLTAAARLYVGAGFHVTEEHEHAMWGATVTEQRYDLGL